MKSCVVVMTLLSIFVSAYEIPQSTPPRLFGNEILKQISDGVSAVADHANRGIVFVSVEKVVKGMPFGGIDPFEFFFGPQMGRKRPQMPEQRQKGLGSGFFIDLNKGYILTNNHVIDEADEISLKLSNGKTYAGKVVGRDKNTDIAVVEITDKKYSREGVVALSLSDSDKVRVGDLCVAVGAPFGLEASVSLGVVSALGRDSLSITEIGDFIQTDAAINPGNSGGPLLDGGGEVIGMNTAIFSKSGGYNGIGFAIPANIVRTIANQLIKDGKVERGYLGVLMSEVDTDLAKELGVPAGEKGVLLRQVTQDSPAGKAGLRDGDVILEMDGRKIQGSSHLRNYIGLQKPGQTVKLVLIRDKKKQNISVKLGSFDEAEKSGQQGPKGDDNKGGGFGFDLSNVNENLRSKYGFKARQGAVVTQVYQGSAAQEAGIEEGDVIVRVGDQAVSSSQQFYKIAKGRKKIFVRIERQGQFLFVPLVSN
jgi:serine protease Do